MVMNKTKALILFLAFLTSIYVGAYVFLAKGAFLRKFDPKGMGSLYSRSQYVVGSGSEGIGDDGLYAYAGYYYFFDHGNITQINFEHPPLGKYLIGFSIFIFHNENVINLYYYVGLLGMVYLFGRMILDDYKLAIIAVLLVAVDPLILDNLVLSLLDIPFTLFFLCGVYFFIKGFKQCKFFYFSFFFWGITSSIKFFPAFLFVYLFQTILVFFYKRNFLISYFKASLLVPFIYLLSHVAFFVYTPSLIEFIRFKKWTVAWWSGSPRIMGNIFRNIFTGYYVDSTKNIVSNEYWTILWPFFVILSMLRFRIKILSDDKQLPLLATWGLIVIYVLYTALFTGGLQKFLMPVWPFLVIISIHSLESFYSIIKQWKKPILRQ